MGKQNFLFLKSFYCVSLSKKLRSEDCRTQSDFALQQRNFPITFASTVGPSLKFGKLKL